MRTHFPVHKLSREHKTFIIINVTGEMALRNYTLRHQTFKLNIKLFISRIFYDCCRF